MRGVREEGGKDVVFVSSVSGHVHVDEGVVAATPLLLHWRVEC